MLDLWAVAAINGLYVALGSPALPKWTANGGDPCGDGWQGVVCIGSNIDSMYVHCTFAFPLSGRVFIFCAFINSLFVEFSMLQIWKDS